MTCGNPIKNKIKNILGSWLDIFSIERELTDYQMECKQFGIYDYAQRKVKEVPFFFLLNWIYFINVYA